MYTGRKVNPGAPHLAGSLSESASAQLNLDFILHSGVLALTALGAILM
jgi:hypothetical protein